MEGIEFLKGKRETEDKTLKVLEGCCNAHPDCKQRKECEELFATRCGSDPRHGGWGWPFKDIYRAPNKRFEPDIKRYANSIPCLQSSRVGIKEFPILRM